MLWLGFLSFCALGVSVAASVTSGILGVDLLPREQNSTTALIDCLTTAGLEPVTPSHPAYQNDSLPVNTRLIYQPAALVYPNTTEDVSAAIKCGAANDVKVNARSGGHSCTSASETRYRRGIAYTNNRCLVQHGWRGRAFDYLAGPPEQYDDVR